MNQAAYVELLSAAPGSCSAIRKELEKIHGLRIPGSTYRALMNSLIALFGIDGATIVAGDVVDIINARKAMTRIMGKREKGLVEALLMDDITKAAKRGRAKLGNGDATAITPQQLRRRTPRKRIISHDHIQLPSVEYGCGLTRANAIAYRPIQTITNLGCSTLKARSNWREKNPAISSLVSTRFMRNSVATDEFRHYIGSDYHLLHKLAYKVKLCYIDVSPA